jgi:hypothetical protein
MLCCVPIRVLFTLHCVGDGTQNTSISVLSSIQRSNSSMPPHRYMPRTIAIISNRALCTVSHANLLNLSGDTSVALAE